MTPLIRYDAHTYVDANIRFSDETYWYIYHCWYATHYHAVGHTIILFWDIFIFIPPRATPFSSFSLRHMPYTTKHYCRHAILLPLSIQDTLIHDMPCHYYADAIIVIIFSFLSPRATPHIRYEGARRHACRGHIATLLLRWKHTPTWYCWIYAMPPLFSDIVIITAPPPHRDMRRDIFFSSCRWISAMPYDIHIWELLRHIDIRHMPPAWWVIFCFLFRHARSICAGARAHAIYLFSERHYFQDSLKTTPCREEEMTLRSRAIYDAAAGQILFSLDAVWDYEYYIIFMSFVSSLRILKHYCGIYIE